jgi:hypothetical protein
MQHVWGTTEMHTRFLKEGDLFEDFGLQGKIILNWILSRGSSFIRAAAQQPYQKF